MFKRTGKTVASLLVCGGFAFGVAACGSSSSSSSSSSTSTSAAAAGSASSSSSSTSAAGSGGNAAAAAAIAPYIGKPGAFPVIDKLAKVPKGAKIAYMDCGTPICALFYQLLQPAAKTMGVNLLRVNSGSAANTVSAAFDTVVSEKPAAVITTAINIQLWSKQLKELQAAKIPVVTTGITGTAADHIPAPQAAEAMSNLEGKLLADYIAAKLPSNSNIVYYSTPELGFTLLVGAAFKAELAKVCPGCKVRTTAIPVATIGNTAPNTVVADLQANPTTTVAVFGTDEAETGVPAALHQAGLTKVKTIGNAPSPTNLEYVKEGKEFATLGYDLPVASWELLDQAAREIAGQKLTANQAKGIIDVQFLAQPDIKFNPAMGWTGYPDFAKRFVTLWGVG